MAEKTVTRKMVLAYLEDMRVEAKGRPYLLTAIAMASSTVHDRGPDSVEVEVSDE